MIITWLFTNINTIYIESLILAQNVVFQLGKFDITITACILTFEIAQFSIFLCGQGYPKMCIYK